MLGSGLDNLVIIAQTVLGGHLTYSDLLVTAALGGVNIPHITDGETA